jgi:hypothetical protein
MHDGQSVRVSIRGKLLSWLDRGGRPLGEDPDAPVEVANVSIFEGPRLVAFLADNGIEAHGIEATTDALHGSAQTRMRLLVRRGEASSAVAALRDYGLTI